MNLNDIAKKESSPDVLVQGLGVYTLDQCKKQVQAKLHDLVKRVDNLMWNPGEDQSGWKTIDILLKKQTLQAFAEAVAKATQEEGQ